jgi:hypothetical protein
MRKSSHLQLDNLSMPMSEWYEYYQLSNIRKVLKGLRPCQHQESEVPVRIPDYSVLYTSLQSVVRYLSVFGA